MVDNLSVEARIKQLLEESQSCGYPHDNQTIKRRYRDTALVLFKESQEEDGPPRNYLTFGTRRSSAVSQYGNTPIVFRRSRSSNGELATVVQQLPTSSLRNRPSKSDYTLVEAQEDQDSDSDTEEDHSYLGRDRSASVVKSPKLEKLQKSTHETDGQASRVGDSKEAGESENKKSFSHYDLPLHKTTKENKLEQQNSVENGSGKVTENDPLNGQDESNKIVNSSTHQVHNNSTNSSSTFISSEGIPISSLSNTIQPESTVRSPSLLEGMSTVNSKGNRSEEKIDHDAVLREYVRGSSFSQKHEGKDCSMVELKIVESTDNLEILDDPDARSPNSSKSLTTTDIMQLNNEDLIYIDAKSPPLAKKIICSESPLGSSEDLPHGKGGKQEGFEGDTLSQVPRPDKKAKKVPVASFSSKPFEKHVEESAEEIPKNTGNSKKHKQENRLEAEETAGNIKKIKDLKETLREEIESEMTTTDISKSGSSTDNSLGPQEDIIASQDLVSHGVLMNLPLRSPTPPKRSPRWTPRSPKSRDKQRQRHSSLVLPPESETQQEPSLSNGTRSASPNTKMKEGKFFSFTVKKEKSKSVSSLSVKKTKERRKLSAINFREDQLNMANVDVAVSPSVESPYEVYGKRVGVRSMVIDGTIKRNFIVIHPSDESETIGLAPVSSPSNSSCRRTTPQEPSEALSSIKSRISCVNMDNLQRISSQTSMKEGMILPTGDQQNHSRSAKATRSLRLTKSRKSAEHKGLRGSQSLPSESGLSTSTGSLVLKSPVSSPSSEVVGHANTASTSGLSNAGTRTVSRLCVIQ